MALWEDYAEVRRQFPARGDGMAVVNGVACDPDAAARLMHADAEIAALRARVEALEAALRERDGGDHDRECRIWMSNWQKRQDRYCNCGHVEVRALLEQKP